MIGIQRSSLFGLLLVGLLYGSIGADVATSIRRRTPLGPRPYPPLRNPSARTQNYILGAGIDPRRWQNAMGARVRYAQRRNPANGEHFTEWVCATLTASILGRGSGTNSDTQQFARRIGRRDDQAGHILAQMLGFPGTQRWNITPMRGLTNKSPYVSVEYQIRKLVRERFPLGIQMYVRMEYSSTRRTRPIRFWIMVRSPFPVNSDGSHFICVWVVGNP